MKEMSNDDIMFKSNQLRLDPHKMDFINNKTIFLNGTTTDDTTLQYYYGINVGQLTGKVLFFIFTAIGLASNIALIGIYKKKNLTLRFNSLMLTLAFFDLAAVASCLLTAILQLTIGDDQNFALLYYLDVALLNCSGYTMVVIALDRYLSLCRGIASNQYRLTIKLTIVKILIVAMVLTSPYYMWNPGNFVYFVITYAWQFVVQALIPCTSLLILTLILYKELQRLKSDEEFANYADEALKKSILKVQLSLLISSIFVISQILIWLPFPYDVRYLALAEFCFLTVQFIFRSYLGHLMRYFIQFRKKTMYARQSKHVEFWFRSLITHRISLLTNANT